jgi:flagellum-specific ATP synthase
MSLPDLAAETVLACKRISVGAPRRIGALVRIVGLMLEARGIVASLGETCSIQSLHGEDIDAEVVGFSDKTTYLMPYSNPSGIGPGSAVFVQGNSSRVKLGRAMLGRVLDARCAPLDGKPAPICDDEQSLEGLALNPMERGPIFEALDVGVKAINAVLTLGKGQRIGLMAGSGVGKSVLLGMITRYTKADVVVIGLVGERGREVNDFIRESLGPEGLAKSVVIAAPADVSPVLRLRAANVAHLIAEYFRDQGLNVLLLVDSLTRVAHAQREIGLAVGEPPTMKGYPPSVFALLPRMIERAGVGRNGLGSVTAIYTVLMEGDDSSDPIVDIARASLDGQVMLSRSLADAAHYPAIDLSGSISRVMPAICAPEVIQAANLFRRLWTLYQQNQDLIKVGAYQSGSNPELDQAIARRGQMESMLRQQMHEGVDIETTVGALRQFAHEVGKGYP